MKIFTWDPYSGQTYDSSYGSQTCAGDNTVSFSKFNAPFTMNAKGETLLLKQNTKVNDRTTVMWNAKNYDRDLDFIIENGSLKIDFQNNTDEFDIQPTFTLEDPFPATTTVRDYFEIRNVNLLSIRSTHFNLRGTGRFEANNTTYIYLGTALSSPNNTKPVTIFDSSSMVLNSSSIISLNSVSVRKPTTKLQPFPA